MQGGDFAELIEQPWTGVYAQDTLLEASLLERFFTRLVSAIKVVSKPDRAVPLHFYVWSRHGITRLMEACARADTDLLGHLRELFGCRESLEQLIFSCLEEEVHGRYALGWTGRGLIVAAGLKWFGRRFHWTRLVNGESVALDRVFAPDLFDWKTALRLGPDGSWRPLDDATARRHTFEVRACFADALPAPYWRAYWGTLPAPDTIQDNPKLARVLRRYRQAGQSGYLKAYLKARTQALRWIEESIRFKNADIAKPLLKVADLPNFTLGVDNAARAALDFLYLEQHIKTNDWVAAHLVPPANRVPLGGTLPVRDVRATGENKITARIDLTGHALDRQALALRCSFAEGAFVRLSPCFEDPHRGQTVGQLLRGGSTCTIERLDWETGRVDLSVIPFAKANRFVLASVPWQEGNKILPQATIDDSPSDFVGGKVEERLQSGLGSYVYRWFDPKQAAIPPQTPLPSTLMARYRALLESLRIGSHPLVADQVKAALEGLEARAQLLQGPPGTGKTQTTAAATLLRILARRQPGDVVLVGANTHTAVDTLLQRIETGLPAFERAARGMGLPLPKVRLAKVHSALPAEPTGKHILDFTDYGSATLVNQQRQDAVLVIGGTPSGLLKLARALGRARPFSALPDKFQTPLLIVDEASMMVLPSFLGLASLVTEDGEILLAGDHRQLAPIVQHDWLNEDRPPTVFYQPYVSAYEAVRSLKLNLELPDAAITGSALTYTFRLPPAIRELIARLYALDDIRLDGPPHIPVVPGLPATTPWEQIWRAGDGLYVVVHTERASKASNATEAAILEAILQAAGELTPGSVGLVMPHRAQRSLLTARLQPFQPAVDVIDTVERLQGGERDTILVSATVSDPAAIHARAEFELSVQRANVAFSRAKRRLIVVVSETLLCHIPAEIELYAAAVLWKSLRSLCSHTLAQTSVNGHTVRVLTVLREVNDENSVTRDIMALRPSK